MGREADEWNACAARLRDIPKDERTRHRDFLGLVEIARRIGPTLRLGGGWVSADDIVGVAHDVIVANLDRLVDAEAPWPYFVSALRNRARDLARKAMRRKEAGADAFESVDANAGSPAISPEAVALTRDLLRLVWSELTPREREIFAAEAAGEKREAVAVRFGVSRASVDQIISRARRRLEELRPS